MVCLPLHETQPIVEIDDAVASGDFPGAPAAFCPRERVIRNHATVGTGARIVTARFTGQDPACLGVAAVEVESRSSKSRARLGERAAVDVEPKVLALEI